MHALGTVVTGWCSAFRGPGGSSQLAADAAPIMMRDRQGVLGGQQPCACRKLRPRRSGCSVVLVDDTSEAVASAYVQPGDLSRIADRFGHRTERGCLIHGLVGAVPVVVFFELPQRPQEVALVPDQGAIEEFVAQFLYPALHDRVHPGVCERQ